MTLPPIDPLWIVIGAAAFGGLLLLVLLVVVVRALTGRQRGGKSLAPTENLSIAVASLPSHGPPADGPRLEFYGTPVRLAVVVLAPAGRGGVLPPRERIPETLERLVPGLSGLLASHRPVLRRWPEQLSTDGFSNAYFQHVKLPGDGGKGTPWCSVTGRFDGGGWPLLAGITCCADRPNSYSTVAVKHEGQWHDALRVKSGE